MADPTDWWHQDPDATQRWEGPDAEEWAEIHAMRMEAYGLRQAGREQEAIDLLREAEVRRQIVAPVLRTEELTFPRPKVELQVERRGHAHPLLFQLGDLED